MDKYPNTCVTCLCNDRKLVSLHKINNILQYIHFTELTSWNGGICWECKNTIMKFYKFKHKVLEVQHVLSLKKVEKLNPFTTLGIKVNLPYNYHYDYHNSDISDNNKKMNIQIKQEIEDSDDEESEIESSDSNLSEPEIKNIKTEIEITDHDYVRPIQDGKKFSNIITMSSVKDSNTKYIKIIPFPCLKIKPLPLLSHSWVNRVKLGLKGRDSKRRKPDPKGPRKTLHVNKDAVEKYGKICDKFIKVIRTEEEMIKHRADKRNQPNRKKMVFKCDFCVIGFLRKANYDAHMQSKHDESIGPYACDICNVRYESKKKLESHRNKHYVYYKCKFCKYSTPLQNTVMNHCKEQHEKDVDQKIHCKQCDAVHGSAHELEQHIQLQHRHLETCDVCGVVCVPGGLKQHKHRMHSTKREFICDVCKKTFTTKSRLETHMTKHSALIAKNMSYCSECKVQFKSLGIYRKHMSARHDNKTYPCSACDKVFPSIAYLRRHQAFIHVRKAKYKCEPCNKSFMLPYQLRNHNQVHHGLSRSRDHACDKCGKEFFTLKMLSNHQITHSDKRPFMCAHCGDTFKQQSALWTHTKLKHKGKKMKG